MCSALWNTLGHAMDMVRDEQSGEVTSPAPTTYDSSRAEREGGNVVDTAHGAGRGSSEGALLTGNGGSQPR